MDPLTDEFSMLTPYQFAANMPIWAKDLDGLEAHLTNQGVVYGPIKTEEFLFAWRIDEVSDASEIADMMRQGTATFSTLAGGMKALADDLRVPKVKPVLKAKNFKDVNGQKLNIVYGKRGEGRLRVTHIKMENPVKSGLRSTAKSIGDITFIIDGSLLFVDAFEAGKQYYVTGDWNNEKTGKLIMNSAGTAMGYFFPVTGGIMLLKDIAEANDGERIRTGLQKQFKEEYYEYRYLDAKKSDRARDRYYELGGEECLGCMKEAELNQGRSN